MTTFWSVLIFAVVGALVGFLGTRIFSGMSLIVSILLGLVGAFGVSWLAGLLGLGTGFLTFSIWGLVFGILGACLTVGIYGFIVRRQAA